MASTPKKKATTPPAKALPADALQALQKLVASSSQAKTAKRLDVSDATISQALRGKYVGNVDKLAERIRGELLSQTVRCPVLGQISTRICQDERGKELSTANPQAVRLFHACRKCPHNPNAHLEAA